jgi:hypothetical protein
MSYMPTRIRPYIISHRWLWPPLLLAGAFLSSILHNVFSGIFKIDEPVFFLLTFLLAVAALVVLIWVLVKRAAEM